MDGNSCSRTTPAPGGREAGTMAQTDETTARYGALIVAIAPAVMAAGLVYHPYITVLFQEGAVAAAVASDTTRWGVAHLTVAVGSGLLLLAFLAIQRYLHAAGEDRFSAWGLAFIAMGSVLFAVLPGMEFAPLAAAESGGDVQAAQDALQGWFVPTFVTGSVIFAIGIYLFGKGIVRSGVLSQGSTWLVLGGLAVVAVARFVPLGAVQFYVQAAAGIVALWPLAYTMWTEPEPPPGGPAEPMQRGT